MKINARRAMTGTLLACGMMLSQAAPAGVPIQSGIYSGVDLLFLSPKISNQGLQEVFLYGDLPPAGNYEYEGSLDTPLDFAQRLFVGYQGEGGGGVRVRWFTFDNTLDYVGEWEGGGGPIVIEGGLNIDVDYIDAELTQMGSFHNWTWLGSAGVRYGRAAITEQFINWEDIPAALYLDETGVEFEGAGPTVSVEGARPIFYPGLSIFANCRTSLLFGESNLALPFLDEPITIDNDFVQVWEIQAGVRHQKVVMDAFNVFSGIFWEAQRWDSDSGFLGDLAFHGFGCQIGVLF
jgi:hypothetical protein